MRSRVEAPGPVPFHWREYLIEGALLGTFMVSASVFGTALFHPASAVGRSLGDPVLRRATMGLAMGATLAALVYSPWGKRSGAHMNPATTLMFWRLGRVSLRDAVLYPVAQFAGAVAGMTAAVLFLGRLRLGHPAVDYVLTRPGPTGALWAFLAELLISSLLVWLVLETAASARLARYTGLFAATAVAIYILVESPVSGMSMNPARSFGSALAAWDWSTLWIYFTAPVVGMQVTAHLYLRRRGRDRVPCAKYRHVTGAPCIFCDYAGPPAAPAAVAPAKAGAAVSVVALSFPEPAPRRELSGDTRR